MEQIKLEEITGVVLAGGKSSRFGTDKGLFPFRGKPLVQHSIDLLLPHCGEVLICTNNPESYAFAGMKTIADIHPGCGPICGMHSGLVHAKGSVVFFLGCDMPLLNGAIFPFLLEKLSGFQAVVPLNRGFRETLCIAMRKECLPWAKQAIQQKKYRIMDTLVLLKVNYPELSKEAFFRDDLFLNINFPEDLPGARKL